MGLCSFFVYIFAQENTHNLWVLPSVSDLHVYNNTSKEELEWRRWQRSAVPKADHRAQHQWMKRIIAKNVPWVLSNIDSIPTCLKWVWTPESKLCVGRVRWTLLRVFEMNRPSDRVKCDWNYNNTVNQIGTSYATLSIHSFIHPTIRLSSLILLCTVTISIYLGLI